jgi:hypothetical protein
LKRKKEEKKITRGEFLLGSTKTIQSSSSETAVGPEIRM